LVEQYGLAGQGAVVGPDFFREVFEHRLSEPVRGVGRPFLAQACDRRTGVFGALVAQCSYREREGQAEQNKRGDPEVVCAWGVGAGICRGIAE